TGDGCTAISTAGTGAMLFVISVLSSTIAALIAVTGSPSRGLSGPSQRPTAQCRYQTTYGFVNTRIHEVYGSTLAVSQVRYSSSRREGMAADRRRRRRHAFLGEMPQRYRTAVLASPAQAVDARPRTVRGETCPPETRQCSPSDPFDFLAAGVERDDRRPARRRVGATAGGGDRAGCAPVSTASTGARTAAVTG